MEFNNIAGALNLFSAIRWLDVSKIIRAYKEWKLSPGNSRRSTDFDDYNRHIIVLLGFPHIIFGFAENFIHNLIC